MYDIFYVSTRRINDDHWNEFKKQYPTAVKLPWLVSFDQIKEVSFTHHFWVVWSDVQVCKRLDYTIPEWDAEYLHVFKNGEFDDGIIIGHKNYKISDVNFRNRNFHDIKLIDTVMSTPRPYDVIKCNNYNEYCRALTTTTTELFWCYPDGVTVESIPDFYFSYSDRYNRSENHVFLNETWTQTDFNGLFLLSTNKTVSSKEINFWHLIERKEWNQVCSKTNTFPVIRDITSYSQYLEVMSTINSDLFWYVPSDVDVARQFNFDITFSKSNQYDRSINHMFLNGEHYDGVMLLSKHAVISETEFLTRNLTANRKDWTIIASTPKRYPIVEFTSYDEYLSVVETINSDLFWYVPPTVNVNPDFTFDIYFPHSNRYDRSITHVFKNGKKYQGVMLLSKHHILSIGEFNSRCPITNVKQWDIEASTPKRYPIVNVSSYTDYINTMFNTDSPLVWIVPNNVELLSTFEFDTIFGPTDTENLLLNHVFLNGNCFNGVFLASKLSIVTEEEFNHRSKTNSMSNQHAHHVIASVPTPFDRFIISSYDDYLDALETTSTEMFWCIWTDVKLTKNIDVIAHEFTHYDYSINHIFLNRENNNEGFVGGIFLCTKTQKVSRKEIENRYLVEKKEWDEVVSESQYPIHELTDYHSYLNLYNSEKSEMFWGVWKNLEVLDKGVFKTYYPCWTNEFIADRSTVHVYGNSFNGGISFSNSLTLFSKRQSPISEVEFNTRWVVDRKEHNEIVSCYKPYDIVFISYNEPSADANYHRLLRRYPNAKRVHGVKGIQNAHKAAAELSSSNMLWVVDGDAEILDSFEFNFEVQPHDFTTVFVWKSKNPINGLEYGHGGVKLLPTALVTESLPSIDFTTSLSNRFRVINQVSNWTNFNTDPFNTWKTAFRECVKLASKAISRANAEETAVRLETWCTVAHDVPYAEFSLIGAKMGKEYGITYRNDVTELAKINDFEWLENLFKSIAK